MNIGEFFFSWRGEISRMPYFLGNLAIMFGVGIPAFLILFFLVGAAMMTGTTEGAVGSAFIGFGLIVPLVLLAIYCQTVLMVKRLHDIGWSGKHVFWIYGLSFIANAFSSFEEGPILILGVLLSLGSLVVYLWLLFMPGQGRIYYKDVFE